VKRSRAVVAGVVVGIVALVAAIVFRDDPAEADPNPADDRNADDRNADNPKPTPDADKPTAAPGSDKAGPVAAEPSRDRSEIRRQLFEDEADSPSSWPVLPSDYIRAEMIRDLGPLVGECMCEVHPSKDEVAVLLDFTLISAPEIGGVIEAVEPREGNQAAGPLLECIRESAFSMALPAASVRGSSRISLHASTDQCDEYLAGETG
jgi:hypothetical protein